MREIKFRAWDEKERVMYRSKIAGHADDGDVFIGHIGFFKGTLMQFTGLKDCNGKEIYEGDIVSGVTNSSFGNKKNTKFKAEVKWDEEDTGFYYSTNIGNMPYIKMYYAEEVETIGNIHNNPELIKEP